MIVFLTSSPSGPLNEPNDERLLDFKNDFVKNLKKFWKEQMKGLIICASPDTFDGNDEMKRFFEDAFRNSGVPVTSFDLWDHRTKSYNIHDYDIIMLGGGHVPTQNHYFKEIHLRVLMKDYRGIVLGVSAGTMNSADTVYAQPELPGEASNQLFERYLQGLNLTTINILPHYQMVKDYYLDGKRLFEDITYPDSFKSPLYCLNDGSYVLIQNGKATIHGEAYVIQDGQLRIFNTKNNIREL